MFLFHSFASFGACFYVQYLFDAMRNQVSRRIYLLELMKTRLKVRQNNISRKNALIIDQWKIFAENYEPIKLWLWLWLRLALRRTNVVHDFLPSWFEFKRDILLSWQKKFSNLRTSCNFKPKSFLWTKFLENLFLAVNLISVPVGLRIYVVFD